MTIAKTLKSLHLDKEEIWITSASSPLSYPEDGNASCFTLEDSSFWFRHRNRVIINAVRQYPPQGAILDIGGGNGFVAQALLAECFDVTVLEPGRIGAENARKNRKIPEVINASFEDVHFPDASLSAVGIFDVLEHIENDKGFLDLIFKALKPNGFVYLTVPAFPFLWSESDIDAGHFRRYTREDFQTLIHSRYILRYFTYFFSVLTLPTFLFRRLPFVFHLNNRKNLLSKESEHGTRRGPFIRMMSKVLDWEFTCIKNRGLILLGTSCLVILEKNNDKNPI